jgi:hypothetical protein
MINFCRPNNFSICKYKNKYNVIPITNNEEVEKAEFLVMKFCIFTHIYPSFTQNWV